MISDDIETVYSSEWHQGFQCEAMTYIDKDKDGYYYALHISPQQDEQPIRWHGPVATQEEARKGMFQLYEKWNDTDGVRWQEWEDRQIEDFERQEKRGG